MQSLSHDQNAARALVEQLSLFLRPLVPGSLHEVDNKSEPSMDLASSSPGPSSNWVATAGLLLRFGKSMDGLRIATNFALLAESDPEMTNLFLGLTSVVIGFPVWLLLSYHLWLMSKGMTTLDHIKSTKNYLAGGTSPPPTRQRLGCWTSLRQSDRAQASLFRRKVLLFPPVGECLRELWTSSRRWRVLFVRARPCRRRGKGSTNKEHPAAE